MIAIYQKPFREQLSEEAEQKRPGCLTHYVLEMKMSFSFLPNLRKTSLECSVACALYGTNIPGGMETPLLRFFLFEFIF